MGIEPARIRELQVAAGQFGSRNHVRYLSEALQAVRRPRRAADGVDMRPVEALELLAAMQGTAYASRRDEKPALADVGHWLEQRLARDPAIEADDLALELGWLKRLATFEDSLKKGTGSTGNPSGAAVRRFGQQAARLRLARAQQLAPREAEPTAPTAPEPETPAVEPPKPATGPAEIRPPVRVQFANFRDANQAWRKAKERMAKGKAPKDRPQPLLVLDGDRVPPGTALALSYAHTEGLAEVFDFMYARGGASLPFRAVAFATDGEPRLVIRVEVDPDA